MKNAIQALIQHTNKDTHLKESVGKALCTLQNTVFTPREFYAEVCEKGRYDFSYAGVMKYFRMLKENGGIQEIPLSGFRTSSQLQKASSKFRLT